MASIDPQQRPTYRVGDVRTPAVSFELALESGELLDGTPLVVEETTSDLTLTNKAINTAELVVNHRAVAIGQAVQFKISGQKISGSPYVVLVTATSDGGQTFADRKVIVTVVP